MKLPRYPKYKESGVKWLGQVPEHWDHAHLRWISRRYAGGTPDRTKIEYWTDGTIPWLNSGAVNDPLITEPSAFITEEALRNSSARWVPANSLLIALAGQGKTKGMVAQLAFRSTCNQSMAAIIPNEQTNVRFLFWWLTSNYQNIRNLAGGDLRDGLNLELLGSIDCPALPFPEQTLIASFLDEETKKIDALIAEQQRLVESLKGKRRAIIALAVVKGLNPDVPMKPSGIDWIDAVPSNWRILKLKFVIRKIEQGWSPQCENVPAEEGEWSVLKVGCVNGGRFNPQENKKLPQTLDPEPKLGICKDDLLISRANTRELVGSAAVTLTSYPKHMLCDKLYRLTVGGDKCNPHYVALFLSTPSARSEIELAATGASQSMVNIAQSVITNMVFPVPPLDEQQKIVEHIADEDRKLESLINKALHAVVLLQERRSALIAAAVTGQIDVRNYCPEEAPAVCQ